MTIRSKKIIKNNKQKIRSKKLRGGADKYFLSIADSRTKNYVVGDIVKSINFYTDAHGHKVMKARKLKLDGTESKREITAQIRKFELLPNWLVGLADRTFPMPGTQIIALKSSSSGTYKKGDIGRIIQILPSNNKYSKRNEILVDFGKNESIINPSKFKKNVAKPKSKSKTSKSIKKRNAVISYNISWATQDNIEAGSEINFVRFCKQKAKEMLYDDTNSTILSYCTNNTANFLAHMAQKYNLEIIGIQEPSDNQCASCASSSKRDNLLLIKNIINIPFGKEVYNVVKSRRFGPTFVGLIYNTSLGNPITILELDLSSGRPLQVVFFEKMGYLVINAHFPHKFNKSQYGEVFSNVNDLVKSKLSKHGFLHKIKRIIVTGDFNDHRNYLNEGKKQITISDFLGKDLVCGNGKDAINTTCCFNPKTTDTIGNVRTISDYVFDSEKQHYFGVPREYNSSIPHSDHLPVIGISK